MLAELPDISDVDREFYTLLYEYQVKTKTKDIIKSTSTENNGQRQILTLSGINYRATAYLNGTYLPEILFYYGSSNKIDDTTNHHRHHDGMFRRRSYDVTNGGTFQLLIEPPLHPGRPIAGGQGGDHSLAQDGATAQFMLGWDWCQAMPDRATGFFGAVELHTTTTANVVLQDPAIQTLEIDCDDDNSGVCTTIRLRILVRISCFEYSGCILPDLLEVHSDWGESWKIKLKGSNNDNLVDVAAAITVKYPDRVRLWWPHGLDTIQTDVAHLHEFRFEAQSGETVLDSTSVTVGIRTIHTYLDERLQGQVFEINSKRIYLLGANWIASDQALRFSSSKERYCNELSLFRYSGLNLVRVWGGGVAETKDFYECADQLGLLVFQEFWMTGDNNGRWAGNYSWPLDYSSYLENVEDVVRRLRRHPSLLFYGGCNECFVPRNSTWFPNPPAEIDNGIRFIISNFDPGRFYITSSMGGKNLGDTAEDPELWANRSYSLAFADGPYSLLMPWTSYERNPGLRFKNISIGFQPEVGSTSSPATYDGLLRFMTEEEAELGYPRRGSQEWIGQAWDFHKFQSWKTATGNSTYDHVYAYLPNDYRTNASEWAAAAQLASHAHYQHLFSGFVSHIFEYTSAVLLWKGQSPWPALRGFLYDWFLESTGTLRGVRAALSFPHSAILDMKTWQVKLINRSVDPFPDASKLNNVSVSFSWFDLNGKQVDAGTMVVSKKQLPMDPMSAVVVFDQNERLAWPSTCSKVCFLRLQVLTSNITSSTSLSSTWYWLSKPNKLGKVETLSNNLEALGNMRRKQRGTASVSISQVQCDHNSVSIDLSLTVTKDAEEPLFYPTLTAHIGNKPILPLFDSGDTEALIVQGQRHTRTISMAVTSYPSAPITIRVTSWNAPTFSVACQCGPDIMPLVL